MEVPANKIPTILIVGAGIGGLSFYQSVRKNLGKKFHVKIFDRETSPQDRWQGYNIFLNRKGVTSLLYCTPPEVQARLPEAIPGSTPRECHTLALTDHVGRYLLYLPHQQTKNIFEIEPLKHDFAGIVAYRNILRDVLSEGVDIQWGKKCVGYEESDDGVWALFEDGTREFGDLLIGADGINSPNIAVPKHLANKSMSIYSNSVVQESLGKNGDFHFAVFRFIPIDQSDEPTYRITLAYIYPTKFDIKDNISIDDDNPESVIKHTISRIKQLRPPCELTDLLIELFSCVPFSHLGEKYPFRTYNPPRRRQFLDVYPLSVPPWKNDRIVLLGDAAHAMNPILGLGANNALQDADLLTKELRNYENDNLVECIRRYNEQMRVRSSKDVMESRNMILDHQESVGNFGSIIPIYDSFHYLSYRAFAVEKA
ncbi:18812_t:CDS:2 [Racocetra fulgida]|uniref:18812_t:CDS:1 n=1 Tax=Racocetra fulgida TaxID=60492 RepID=A0A9N9CG90_9GLOM|nr:18812_t:CDS:2 [Racocetra fulgida]